MSSGSTQIRLVKLAVSCIVGFIMLGAVLAGSAQAVTSEWMIEGKTISELKLKEEEEKDSLVGGSLSLSVPSKKFTIECKEVKGTGEIDKGGFGELSASLNKCEIPAVKTCKVSEPLTLTAKYTTLETGGKYYAKVEGVGGKPLMTVVLSNPECPLPLKTEVKGTVAAEFSFQPSKKQSLKFSESISKKVNEALVKEGSSELKLMYGASLAFLGGEPILELSGESKGSEWWLIMGTQLCKQRPAAGTNACAPGQVWPAGTSILAEKLTEMKFTFGVLKTTCTTSEFEGTTNEGQGAPLMSTFSVFATAECNNKCSVELQTSEFGMTTTGEGNGLFFVYLPKLEFVCAGSTCVFGRPAFRLGEVIGGEPGVLTSGAAPLVLPREKGLEEVCGAFVTWAGTGVDGAVKYQLVEPTKFFLTD